MQDYRAKLNYFFNHPWANFGLGALILLNMITLGIEISDTLSPPYHTAIRYFNHFVLVVFAIEVMGRIFAEGRAYFQSGWHVFDFIVVLLALISFGGAVQVFRALRILWLLRMFTIAPRFRHLISSLVHALPNVVVVATLLVMFIYIAALIATSEFGATNPEYSGIFQSMRTLATTMLIPHSWSERYHELAAYPYAWAFIFPVMIILNYLLLQMVIGIIVSAINKQYKEEVIEEQKAFLSRFLATKSHHTIQKFPPETQAILHELAALRAQIAALPLSVSSTPQATPSTKIPPSKDL